MQVHARHPVESKVGYLKEPGHSLRQHSRGAFQCPSSKNVELTKKEEHHIVITLTLGLLHDVPAVRDTRQSNEESHMNFMTSALPNLHLVSSTLVGITINTYTNTNTPVCYLLHCTALECCTLVPTLKP